MRDRIRENIDQYDKIHEVHLGHYLNGDLEWPQYFLPDENDAEPLQCPLRFKNDK
ncbi:YqcI/YcgG family protein [Gallibacterium anatis]|uniref:YqcI/YcgG family protein n=1 Tax=Gallibacterium anatis TaxID=750 RepID=A0A930UR79_9PAST|nr:YqcI/YcgG family protein [Gallibacterium anatis]